MSNGIADVVIVGAGMAGVAAAYQLSVRASPAIRLAAGPSTGADAGARRIALVDSRQPLSLTSSQGTEAYRNYWPGPDDTMVRFMNRSIDLLDALDAESEGSFDFNRRGYVFLTADPAEAARLRTHDGATAQFVEDTRAIRAHYPFVTERAVALLHVHRAGYLNATKLGHWLLARAQSRGVNLIRDEVIGLVVENQRFVGVRLASGTRIDAAALILAAGPRLPQWSAQLQITVPIVNELHGKICFEDTAGVLPRDLPLMIWNDPVNLDEFGILPPGVHLRPRGTQLILGIWTYDSRVEEPKFPPAFAPAYPEVVIRGLSAMIPRLQAYVPHARDAVVDGGYYCKAPDNRPLSARRPSPEPTCLARCPDSGS